MPSRPLHASLLLAALACSALLPAQTTTTKKQEPAADGRWRLEHRLEKPLLYLSRMGPALVDPLPLLDDPVLQQLLGQRAPGGYAAGRYSALLRPLARLLSNQSEDLELALTRMVRAVNADTETPSLIFRCQLVPESAGQVGKVLRESLATPSRKLHGQQVYRLKAPPKSRHDNDTGTPVEVVLAGNNLVVSTDPVALGQAISPQTTASAKVLSQSPRYKDLRTRIDVPKGAVMLYAHWGRLGPRLSRLVEMELGLPFWWSGLGDTDQVMVVIRPARRGSEGFVTSVLLGRRLEPPPHWPAHLPWGHDGWLQAVEATKPQQLLSGLHAGGVGSLAVAVNPRKLLGPAARSPRMQRLQSWIFGHAFQVGVDVRRQIIRRLGKTGGAQVVLLPGKGVVPRVAYSFQAKTSKQARDLVTDLKKALANSGRARAQELDSGKEVLRLQSPGFGGRKFGGYDYAFLGAVGETVYFTFDRATMERLVELARNKSRQSRLQRESMVRQYLKQLGALDKKVAGIFAIDLSSIATRVTGKPKTEPGLFGMHAGYLTVEQDLVRLEVFSPR